MGLAEEGQGARAILEGVTAAMASCRSTAPAG